MPVFGFKQGVQLARVPVSDAEEKPQRQSVSKSGFEVCALSSSGVAIHQDCCHRRCCGPTLWSESVPGCGRRAAMVSRVRPGRAIADPKSVCAAPAADAENRHSEPFGSPRCIHGIVEAAPTSGTGASGAGGGTGYAFWAAAVANAVSVRLRRRRLTTHTMRGFVVARVVATERRPRGKQSQSVKWRQRGVA